MGKPSYPRTRRLNAIIREVLADEVEALNDPRLGMITMTGVDTAPDMRRATVYVSALDRNHLEEAIKGLTAAAPRLRVLLGKQVRIKFTPQLEFKADTGVLQGERIDAVLRELEQDG
ncbi:MAG: 30S ribosome-binding factor RbfA [Acidimicrobiia bacterium]|nr:30S ribosome-binding factor RbfA [Acidimicrobiia bacterium]MDQ3501065.1 30S ribosome-binding factor RbfA [Actinomycetota bacterium]